MSKENIETLVADIKKIESSITEIQQPIAKAVNELKEQRVILQGKLDAAITESVSDAFSKKDYGCGTVNFETDNLKIKVVVRKTVKWDEGKLKVIENLIKEGGQDPENFIKYKRSVLEGSYKDFTDEIKKVFEPARSVEPSKPTTTIEQKD